MHGNGMRLPLFNSKQNNCVILVVVKSGLFSSSHSVKLHDMICTVVLVDVMINRLVLVGTITVTLAQWLVSHDIRGRTLSS